MGFLIKICSQWIRIPFKHNIFIQQSSPRPGASSVWGSDVDTPPKLFPQFSICEGAAQPLTGLCCQPDRHPPWSTARQSGLAKEPHRGRARDAAGHLFCISFFLFHTVKAKRYEAFPTAPSPASKDKGSFICIRNPTQMNQILFYLSTNSVGNISVSRSKGKVCSLLENRRTKENSHPCWIVAHDS